MTKLQHAISRGLGWRRQERAVVQDLASETGVDAHEVAKIFDGLATHVHRPDADDIVRATLDATQALNKLRFSATAIDEAALGRYMSDVREPDLTIFREHIAGKKYWQIAALLGMDKGVVLRSLARTYADLRMRMLEPNDSEELARRPDAEGVGRTREGWPLGKSRKT